MALLRAIPWSETLRVGPHLHFPLQARTVPRFGWARALLGSGSGSYAGGPCLGGSDSRPLWDTQRAIDQPSIRAFF